MAEADGRLTERRCHERGRWRAREGKVYTDSEWAFAATDADTWDLWNAHDRFWAGAKNDDGCAY